MTATIIKPQVKLTFEPNSEQQSAINQFLKWFHSKDSNRLFELSGVAGSGKTATLAQMLKTANLRWSDVILAAPVNKAAFVLQQSLHAAGLPRFECKTIHSALGISVSNYDENGNPIFDTKKGNAEKVKGLKLLIIDEKSMIGADLLEAIQTLAPSHLRILFCGDSYQLPPVSKSAPLLLNKADYEAGLFIDPFSLSPSIGCAEPQDTAELIKIMRQDGGCAVDLLACVRETIADADQFMRELYADPNSQWSFTPSISLFQPERDESLQEYGSRKALLSKAIELFRDRRRVKLIAYKNSTVNFFQQQIFSQLFPSAQSPYPIGCYIQLKAHWRNGGSSIIVPAGCEGYVVESQVLTAYFGGSEIEYYSLLVDFGELFGNVLLKVPTEQGLLQVKNTLATVKTCLNRESGISFTPDTSLRSLCHSLSVEVEVNPLATVAQAIGFSNGQYAKEHGATVFQAMQMGMLQIGWKPGWTWHHELENSFAQIEHGFSCTIYRSQGSTYDEVLLCNDMPRFTIAPWQWDRNAIDLLKVQAKLKTAALALKQKKGHDTESYSQLVATEFEQWLEPGTIPNDLSFEEWQQAVTTEIEEALDKDQYLPAYTRQTRGMEPRLCLRALYVAASRHRKTLHFFDSSTGYE